MSIVDYIYYCLYCFATAYNKESGQHARTLGVFSITLAFNIVTVINLTGLRPVLKSWPINPLFIIGGVCLLISLFYFTRNNKNADTVNYFKERKNKIKAHALIGAIYFLGTVALFAFVNYQMPPL